MPEPGHPECYVHSAEAAGHLTTLQRHYTLCTFDIHVLYIVCNIYTVAAG